jgi:hypothetical protein
LQAGQAQKELTHNEALALIDMLLHAQVESMTVATPPGGAVVGQCWVVAYRRHRRMGGAGWQARLSHHRRLAVRRAA